MKKFRTEDLIIGIIYRTIVTNSDKYVPEFVRYTLVSTKRNEYYSSHIVDIFENDYKFGLISHRCDYIELDEPLLLLLKRIKIEKNKKLKKLLKKISINDCASLINKLNEAYEKYEENENEDVEKENENEVTKERESE